jgi:hypothetical protein
MVVRIHPRQPAFALMATARQAKFPLGGETASCLAYTQKSEGHNFLRLKTFFSAPEGNCFKIDPPDSNSTWT